MKNLPMRRSKLVGTEGPGALVISPEGETAVVGALDLWFRDFYGNESSDLKEFEVNEPRLKSVLKVDKFYTPPEFRKRSTNKMDVVPNTNLIIPLMRFPKWHYCGYCKTLKEFELDESSSFADCPECIQKRIFKQVPFVVICEHGHLSDFPWREWVHGSEETNCKGNLIIKTSGGTTLDSWSVSCKACNSSRDLNRITSEKKESGTSYLGDNLNKNKNAPYTCPGERPWCGTEKEICSAAPVAILRNSINVYMARKISALAIPGDYTDSVDAIVSAVQSPSKMTVRENLKLIAGVDNRVQFLRNSLRFDIDKNTSDEDFHEALLYLESGTQYQYTEEELERPGSLIKEKEFEKLIGKVNTRELKVVPEWTFEKNGKEENYFSEYFERISRVLRLKETTALYGFDRKDYKSMSDYSSYYHLLYKNIEDAKELWLPVNEVYGEGIFLQFNVKKIKKWESSSNVKAYFENYLARVSHVNHREEMILTPGNIMMHTFSHFLIDELANICGYSRASIRERLYLDENQCGVLIYISAGDAEGTLGGLVRLGLKDKIFHIIDKAKNNAEWCSSDPVCTEIGTTQGQGINGINGAACYNCSHIPETSCEYWNLYLDRSLLVDPTIGYFR
ncbi:hypothetical protein CQS04_09730 [Chryseomicrobium excrementi]|uniref:MrfA-like Zn-binding domain-containing protein n=1 Tax=Chryseomicrobium excrementi TaxID=2041346 RepID=A0A2M9EY92_9BACL|nr:DUF1998 domain-containing protein [Chryseomicrobium excrementi]PJK16183.1 hypothetical protein CQS04_09730 [Chryseomicrobium excrementi]